MGLLSVRPRHRNEGEAEKYLSSCKEARERVREREREGANLARDVEKQMRDAVTRSSRNDAAINRKTRPMPKPIRFDDWSIFVNVPS